MTTLGVTHTFVSAIPNSGDASLVEPSDWNATHTLTGIFSSTTLNNTFIGADTGNLTVTGTGNTAIGVADMASVSSGINNVALGLSACAMITTGNRNMAIGAGALFTAAGNSDNVAIGNRASFSAASGAANVAIGSSALDAEDSGVGYNTAIGFCAGNLITSGFANVVIGANDSTTNGPTTGDYNTLIGTGANLADPTADKQLCIMNMIYGTTLDGAGATISTGAIGIGVKAPAEKLDVNGNIKSKSVRGTAVTFANVPAAPVEGMLVAVTDSTTVVWGATITGTGANHVLAYYNGTNWTVAGK